MNRMFTCRGARCRVVLVGAVVGVISLAGVAMAGQQQASIYGQDHFSPVKNLTVDLGVRYDYFSLVDTSVQTSPRIGLAYHFTKTKSVLHAAYNRYFSPPPIEYSLLASFL